MWRIILLVLLLPFAAYANPIDNKCPQFALFGAPVSKVTTGQYMCRMAYGVHYSFKTKTAEYVVEHITKQHLAGNNKRKNNFHEDPEIASEHRSTLADYKAGAKLYDRGHMAPAEDFKFSAIAMSESFLLSNMVPQISGNNRGIWSILEQRVAKLTRSLGEVYVVSGPIYDPGTDSAIGDGVKVPQRLFKVIADPVSGKTVAFILPNKKLVSNTLPSYMTSVQKVEEATGLELFPQSEVDKETVGALVLPPLGK